MGIRQLPINASKLSSRPPGLDEYFLKYLTEGFDRFDVPSSASQCDLKNLWAAEI